MNRCGKTILGIWITGMLLLAQGAWAQQGPPTLTGTLAPGATLRPPMGERLLFRAQGKGVQIYSCASGDNGYAWTLKAPEAKLIDSNGREIGAHSAGPRWALTDGSAVTGKATVTKKSPYHDAIPWLLLAVQSHQGAGKLTGANYIQRTDTHGGAAPEGGCDAAKAGSEVRIPYTARYSFFGK